MVKTKSETMWVRSRTGFEWLRNENIKLPVITLDL